MKRIGISFVVVSSLFGGAALAHPPTPNKNFDDVPPGQQWLASYREKVTPEHKQVAVSVGTLILIEDDGGHLGLEVLFDEEYQKIRKLPLQYRKEFFWALMFRLRLKSYAHFTEEYFKTMNSDCRKEILESLDTFIKTKERYGSEDPTLQVARWSRNVLSMYREAGKE